jgi:hypothetical protein
MVGTGANLIFKSPLSGRYYGVTCARNGLWHDSGTICGRPIELVGFFDKLQFARYVQVK